MVAVAASVEDDLVDAGGLGPLGGEGADLLGGGDVAAVAVEGGLVGGGGGEGHAGDRRR